LNDLPSHNKNHKKNQPTPNTLPQQTLQSKTMGLLKTGIKYGGIAYAINAIGKGIGAHQESKTDMPSGQYMQQQPHQQQPPAYGQNQGPRYDHTGYPHQSWCDTSCGRQCNGKAS
jgi:hypothetical protein